MSDHFTVEVRADDGSLTLCLAGDLDLATAGTLQACLEQVDGAVRSVVLDLTDLTFLDSSGLNVFVHAHERLTAEARELVLANPRASVRRVLDVSGIDQLIPVTGGALDPSPAHDPA